MKIRNVLESCLYGTNLDEMEAFYGDLLGLERYSGVEGRHVFFRCGNGMLLIFNPDATNQPGQGVPAHGVTGAGHIAFGVPEAELEEWRHKLEAKGVTIEAVVEWPAGGYSLYFRDPAGNSVELTTPKIWRMSEAVLPDEPDC